MKYFRSYLLITCISLLASCTKNFEELNTDPNRPSNVNPGVMLGQVQYRFVNAGVSGANNFTHELMQVNAPRSSTSAGLHRYYVNPGDGVWTNFYSCITDIEEIIKISDKLGEKNYKAIALVYKCWAYSILTDLYGDVPYSEAIKATEGNFLPKFDAQKDIYTQILKDLITANELFDENKALTYGGDYVYASNALSGGEESRYPAMEKVLQHTSPAPAAQVSKTPGGDRCECTDHSYIGRCCKISCVYQQCG